MNYGEQIKFKRGSKVYDGKIIKVKSTCVIVEVSVATQKELNIDTNLTVANFKNIVEGPKLKPVKEPRTRFQIKWSS